MSNPRLKANREAKGKVSVPLKVLQNAAVRDCGPCRVCCTDLDVAEGEIPGHDGIKPSGEACKHLCENGCGIYKDRPLVCRSYLCMWKLDRENFRDDERPDLCGVVVSMSLLSEEGVTPARPGREYVMCGKIINDDIRNMPKAYALTGRLMAKGYPAIIASLMGMPPQYGEPPLNVPIADMSEYKDIVLKYKGSDSWS